MRAVDDLMDAVLNLRLRVIDAMVFKTLHGEYPSHVTPSFELWVAHELTQAMFICERIWTERAKRRV